MTGLNLVELKNKVEYFESAISRSMVFINKDKRITLRNLRGISKYFLFNSLIEVRNGQFAGAKSIWNDIGALTRLWPFKLDFSYKRNLIFSSILLSDSEELFEEFLQWEIELHNEELHSEGAWGFIVFFWFLMNGNRKMAHKELEYWKAMADDEGDLDDDMIPSYWDYFIAEKMFNNEFEDIPEMVVNYLEKQYKLKSSDDDFNEDEKYFSIWGTCIAKKVWRLGHELDFDSPFIDMDLVRISPLDYCSKLEDKLYQLGLNRNIRLNELKQGSRT